jgi:hypothetical protein
LPSAATASATEISMMTAREASSSTASNEEEPGRSSRPRRITLQQVQQSANRLASPVARIGCGSVRGRPWVHPSR